MFFHYIFINWLASIVSWTGSLIRHRWKSPVSAVRLNNHLRLLCRFRPHSVLDGWIVYSLVWWVRTRSRDLKFSSVHTSSHSKFATHMILGSFAHFGLDFVSSSSRERLGVRVGHITALGRAHHPVRRLLNLGPVVSVVVARARICHRLSVYWAINYTGEHIINKGGNVLTWSDDTLRKEPVWMGNFTYFAPLCQCCTLQLTYIK